MFDFHHQPSLLGVISSYLHLYKLTAIVCDQCSDRMVEAVNSWLGIEREVVHVFVLSERVSI